MDLNGSKMDQNGMTCRFNQLSFRPGAFGPSSTTTGSLDRQHPVVSRLYIHRVHQKTWGSHCIVALEQVLDFLKDVLSKKRWCCVLILQETFHEVEVIKKKGRKFTSLWYVRQGCCWLCLTTFRISAKLWLWDLDKQPLPEARDSASDWPCPAMAWSGACVFPGITIHQGNFQNFADWAHLSIGGHGAFAYWAWHLFVGRVHSEVRAQKLHCLRRERLTLLLWLKFWPSDWQNDLQFYNSKNSTLGLSERSVESNAITTTSLKFHGIPVIRWMPLKDPISKCLDYKSPPNSQNQLFLTLTKNEMARRSSLGALGVLDGIDPNLQGTLHLQKNIETAQMAMFEIMFLSSPKCW